VSWFVTRQTPLLPADVGLRALAGAQPNLRRRDFVVVGDGVGVVVGVLSALFDAGVDPGAGFDGSGAGAEVGGLEDAPGDGGQRVVEGAGGVGWLFRLDFRVDEQAVVFGAGLYPLQGDFGEGAVGVAAADVGVGAGEPDLLEGVAGGRSLSCQGNGSNFGRRSSMARAWQAWRTWSPRRASKKWRRV